MASVWQVTCMTIISVQSHVSNGYVGNSAAVFAMQRLGLEVCPVHTTLLAHHPGLGGFQGMITPDETARTVLSGLRELGVYAECRALLSGYLGTVAIGEAVLDAWRDIKRAAPDALYCCAPVIGDCDEGVYVDAALTDFFRDHAVPCADIIIANAFEAELLTDHRIGDAGQARRAAEAIIEQGPSIAIITSVPLPSSDGDELGNLLVGPDGAGIIRTAKLPLAVKGAGDFMAALWLARFLQTQESLLALQSAVAGTQAVIEKVQDHPMQALSIIEWADHWIAAMENFSSQQIEPC
jgi:pyridoxine kinase